MMKHLRQLYFDKAQSEMEASNVLRTYAWTLGLSVANRGLLVTGPASFSGKNRNSKVTLKLLSVPRKHLIALYLFFFSILFSHSWAIFGFKCLNV